MREIEVFGNSPIKTELVFLLLIVFFFDQSSKCWAINYLKEDSFFIWKNVLELKLYENYGLAFGLKIGNVLAIALSLIIIALFFWLLLKKDAIVLTKQSQFGFIFILAGAVSNLFDRICRGYVVDFIRFSPVFVLNLADIFIFLGFGLLVLASFKNKSVI